MAQRPRARQIQQQALERRRQVSALRLAGYRDQKLIAAQLGVNQSTISRDFAWLDEQYRQSAVADVSTEKGRDLQRIDAAIAAIWNDVLQGRAWAHQQARAWLERRAKLLGLDAPARINVDIEAYIRQVAVEEGLDPEEATLLAMQIVREHSVRVT